MEIRNNTNNLAFQARLTPQLKSTLKTYASQKGEKTQKLLRDKMSQVATWGRKDSEIKQTLEFSDITDELKDGPLALFNHSLSTQYGGELHAYKKGTDVKSIFKNFINLSESDILKAEDEIVNQVQSNKVELLIKALDDKNFAEKITGKTAPNSKEIWNSVEKFPEEKITTLRFGLDTKTNDLIPTIEKDGFEWIV